MYKGRAVIGMLRILRDRLWRIKFNEFKKLASIFGYDIVSEIVQVKEKPLSSTLFGRGKIQEIRDIIEDTNAEFFLVYNTLKSIQKLNLERYLGVKVIDRYELTLEIFLENASDNISKLQIELAQIEKEIPYLKMRTRLRYSKDRPYFGAGGEYDYVPKLAEVRKRKRRIREEIERLRREKINQILRRKERGFKITTIVGYYNAGKTSLFNLLTNSDKKVSDIPFTTLESKYSKLIYSDNILAVDTIGFVLDLDPKIIKSFEINVDDMRFADVLLITLDVSDETRLLDLKFDTVYKILKNVNALQGKKIVIAANKIDLVPDRFTLGEKILQIERKAHSLFGNLPPIVKTSALEKIGIQSLAKEIINCVREGF
ncbi:MAG: GTPase [Candidatus Njordarchaeia archaeon]